MFKKFILKIKEFSSRSKFFIFADKNIQNAISICIAKRIADLKS